jgi:hypothetical protein
MCGRAFDICFDSIDKMVDDLKSAGTKVESLLQQYGIPDDVKICNKTMKQAFEDAADPNAALKQWTKWSERNSAECELPNWCYLQEMSGCVKVLLFPRIAFFMPINFSFSPSEEPGLAKTWKMEKQPRMLLVSFDGKSINKRLLRVYVGMIFLCFRSLTTVFV